MFTMAVDASPKAGPKVVVTASSASARRDAEKVEADDALEDFAARFSVLFKVAKLNGGVPIHKTDSGWQFGVRTREFAYSALVYVALFALFAHVICALFAQHVQFSGSRSEFHAGVFNHMFIGLLTAYLLVPVTTWLDAPGIAAYANEWNAFQTSFLQTVGQRLRLKDTRRTQLVLALCAVAFTGATLLVYAPPGLRAWQRLPHLVSIVFSMLNCVYWALCCDAVIDASQQLTDGFKSALRTTETPRRPLAEYRRLWLALSRLAGNTATSLARTSAVFTLTELYLILLAVHGLLTCLLGMHPSRDAVVPYLLATAVTVTAFGTFCDMGYRVTQKVRTGILAALHELPTLNYDCATVREVNLFFQCVSANPPVLSLGGFVTINRSLFKSCCATIFTYLVVVVQFELGLNLSDAADADA